VPDNKLRLKDLFRRSWCSNAQGLQDGSKNASFAIFQSAVAQIKGTSSHGYSVWLGAAHAKVASAQFQENGILGVRFGIVYCTYLNFGLRGSYHTNIYTERPKALSLPCPFSMSPLSIKETLHLPGGALLPDLLLCFPTTFLGHCCCFQFASPAGSMTGYPIITPPLSHFTVP
jgi:hypothetical protein